MNNIRLDILLFNKGLARSREKAKQMIVSNMVYVNDKLVNKPSALFDEDCQIKLNSQEEEFVGRGALKLKKAIETFSICLDNKVSVDVGATTGGFTDFMLKNGCQKVYAIDVGQNQLADNLLNDKRVVSLEKTNFRYIDTNLFKEKIDFICIDVSFISLELIIPKIVEICNDMTDIVALVKPQFEAGKGNVGKNGIVKDKRLHISILNKVYNYFIDNNLFLHHITYSPITGGDGNIEYLIHVRRDNNVNFESNLSDIVKNVVYEAFENLK